MLADEVRELFVKLECHRVWTADQEIIERGTVVHSGGGNETDVGGHQDWVHCGVYMVKFNVDGFFAQAWCEEAGCFTLCDERFGTCGENCEGALSQYYASEK